MFNKIDEIYSEEGQILVRISRIRAEMPGFVLFGVSHTRAGGREGGREQGQPATTNNGETRGKTTKAGNRQESTQQAGRTKEGKAGGEKAHRNPTLARRRANSAKQTGNKAKHNPVLP
jgi:hypothetical protein